MAVGEFSVDEWINQLIAFALERWLGMYSGGQEQMFALMVALDERSEGQHSDSSSSWGDRERLNQISSQFTQQLVQMFGPAERLHRPVLNLAKMSFNE